jgi:hypothetical protein
MAFFNDKKSKDEEEVSISVGGAGNADVQQNADGVFGQVEEGAPNCELQPSVVVVLLARRLTTFRTRRASLYADTNVSWIHASVLLMKAQIGLGVLGYVMPCSLLCSGRAQTSLADPFPLPRRIPSVFSTIGLIPGLIALFAIGVITSWSSFVVGTFKLKHPEVTTRPSTYPRSRAAADRGFRAPSSPSAPSVSSPFPLRMFFSNPSGLLQVHSVADVGYIFGGRIGRELLGGAFFLYMIMISGSGMLGVSHSQLVCLADKALCGLQRRLWRPDLTSAHDLSTSLS